MAWADDARGHCRGNGEALQGPREPRWDEKRRFQLRCELDALFDNANAAELGYVGITRARSYIAAVGTANELTRLRRLERG